MLLKAMCYNGLQIYCQPEAATLTALYFFLRGNYDF